MEDLNIDFDPSIDPSDGHDSYKGDAAADEYSTEDNRHIDNVGPLPSSLRQTTHSEASERTWEASERTWEASERTWEASEMTCEDWSADKGASVQEKETRDYTFCVEDFVRLQIRVAELESREQLERWHERENIELQVRMKQMQEDGLNKRLEAFRVQHFLQERIAKMQKEMDRMRRENELLEEMNQGLLKNQQRQLSSKKSNSPAQIIFRRRSTIAEAGHPYMKENMESEGNGVEGLPSRQLPVKITFKRRSTVGEMEAPCLEGSHKATTSKAEGLPRNITFRRRSVGEMESPYFQENQEATINEIPHDLISNITFKTLKRTSVEDVETYHDVNQEAVKPAADCAPPGEQQRKSLPNITSKGKSAAGKIEGLSLNEIHEVANVERLSSPRNLLSNVTFKRRSTVGEMERPANQDEAEPFPFPKQQRRRTIEARPSLISLCRGLTASISKPPSRPSSFAPSDTSCIAGMTAGASSSKKSPHLEGHREINKTEVNGLPLSQQPREITFRRRSTVVETESPYLEENQEAMKITFRRKSSVHPECIHHNKTQEAIKNAARNTPSKITSKETSDVGEIERVSLKGSHDASKNEVERLPPQNLLSNITFKRRSTVGEMERPAVCEIERPAAQDDVECLPFPKQQRRGTIEAKPSLISLCRGLSDSLNLRKRSPGKLSSLALGETGRIVGMRTSASSSNDLPSMHDSWATANEINSQTEMYNRISSARLRAEFKKDGLTFVNSDHNSLKARPQSDVDGI